MQTNVLQFVYLRKTVVYSYLAIVIGVRGKIKM